MRRAVDSRELGAAAVEFALVAGLLIILLFGILDGGRLWMIQSSLSQAAREGAREMAINNDAADAADVIREYPGFLGQTVTPVVSPTTCTPGARVQTEAQTSVQTLTGFTINLAGKAEMRCGG